MDTLELPDGALRYELAGAGPPLLLLHAGVGDSRMWDPQLAPFAERFRVVRIDMRGYGTSYLPDGPFAFHWDAAAVIDALLPGGAWLVGASFGAEVAVDLALSRPELVKGLVLASPRVSGFEPSAEVRAFGEREDALLEADRLEEATALNVRMWVDGPYRGEDQVDPAIRSLVHRMQLQAFEHPEPDSLSFEKLSPPAIERLEALRCPVLIVTGALDAPEFVGLSQVLVDRIAGARRIVVPEAAHMVNMERPEVFNQAVATFITADES